MSEHYLCGPGARGGWKRAEEFLEVESQSVVRARVSARTQAWVLWKSSYLSRPPVGFFRSTSHKK